MDAAGIQAAGNRRSWSDLFGPTTCVRLAIVSALICFVYWGPIRWLLVARWIEDGNWSHGWLIPLFSLYFVYTKAPQLFATTPRPSYVGAVVLALSLAVYFTFSWVVPMGYLQAVSIVGTIFGVTLLLGGWVIVRIVWFPIVFLLLAVPLPHRVYVELTRPLREWASTAAAAIMPLFVTGLHTEAQAVVIDYLAPGGLSGQLNVEEACSGMRLMMAFVTLGVAMAYLGDRPAWQRVIMVVFCIPIAVFCNTIRVTMTGLFLITGRTYLAQGTPHQLLGIAMLVLALGMFALVGYVLANLFVEVTDDAEFADA